MLLTTLILLTALPYWQDVHVTSVNAETRRTEVIYYPTREAALEQGFRESPNYMDLNGVWDFRYYDDWKKIPLEDGKAAPDGRWDKIQVPGNWEVQGWGIPIYVNHPYDFCPVNPEPPKLPEAFPAALYHRTFTVPEAWKGRQVYLNLCGSKSGTYVYVNGQEIGYSEDSKSVARFNITEALKEGTNDLLLQIFRYSTGSYLECQDFWRISGLERDVYLSSEGQDSGFDFSVVSTVTPDLETGIFKLRMCSSAPTEIAYELLDKDGTAVADAVFEFNGRQASITDSIANPRLWSAETPELYTLLLRVNGEYTRFHVGFRRIEIATVKDGEKDVKALLVNGQPVKFKGVNLHEHNPYTGHYLTRENILEDLKLMRLANINAIRTCHYPQPREFYELCDSLGFYVYDEANIESHGMGYNLDRTLANKPEWWEKHIDRILNLYRRTANYPCVTLLSLGNEAGNGVNFYEAYKVIKALEEKGQNRPVVYERSEYEWNTDMIVPQYPGTDWFRQMGEKYTQRPVCPSEYAHAMGNSTGSLDLQWEQIYAHTHLQGGYIWDWVDQGLYDKERGWTYGGDYGENAPSDDNFNCNGIVNPDRDPHPAYYEVKHVYQDVSITPVDALKGDFQIFNRHYFVSLDGYDVTWWVERDGRKPWYWRRHKLHFTTAPQTAEEFNIKLPRMRKPGEYRIFFEVSAAGSGLLIEKGEIFAFDEVLLKDTSLPRERKIKGKVDVTDGDTRVVVRGPQVEVVFDKVEGYLKSWKVKGVDMIRPDFGLRPNFWRAATDNDYGNWAPRRAAHFRSPGKPVAIKAMKEENGCVSILVAGKDVRGHEKYTIFPDGTIRIEVATEPMAATEEEQPRARVEIPRLGFRFHVDEDAFSYFGRGPVENYWDRNSGSCKRIWKASAQEEYYPYVRPQETGHHTETSWLKVGRLTVRADEPFEFNALRQQVEDLDGGETKSQTHISDVPVQPFTEVCIDYRMTGVGGYDSWGSRPEPARTLWADQPYHYAFTLSPGR